MRSKLSDIGVAESVECRNQALARFDHGERNGDFTPTICDRRRAAANLGATQSPAPSGNPVCDPQHYCIAHD